MPYGMIPEGAGGATKDDFRIGNNPLVINDFIDNAFSATTFLVGFDYTVPALRRCVIERVDVIVRVNGTIIPAGTILVIQEFTLSGGGPNALRILDFIESQGPGVVSLLGLPFGQMLPGDRLRLFLSSTAAGTTGTLRTVIHGVEYDV